MLRCTQKLHHDRQLQMQQWGRRPAHECCAAQELHLQTAKEGLFFFASVPCTASKCCWCCQLLRTDDFLLCMPSKSRDKYRLLQVQHQGRVAYLASWLLR